MALRRSQTIRGKSFGGLTSSTPSISAVESRLAPSLRPALSSQHSVSAFSEIKFTQVASLPRRTPEVDDAARALRSFSETIKAWSLDSAQSFAEGDCPSIGKHTRRHKTQLLEAAAVLVRALQRNQTKLREIDNDNYNAQEQEERTRLEAKRRRLEQALKKLKRILIKGDRVENIDETAPRSVPSNQRLKRLPPKPPQLITSSRATEGGMRLDGKHEVGTLTTSGEDGDAFLLAEVQSMRRLFDELYEELREVFNGGGGGTESTPRPQHDILEAGKRTSLQRLQEGRLAMTGWPRRPQGPCSPSMGGDVPQWATSLRPSPAALATTPLPLDKEAVTKVRAMPPGAVIPHTGLGLDSSSRTAPVARFQTSSFADNVVHMQTTPLRLSMGTKLFYKDDDQLTPTFQRPNQSFEPSSDHLAYVSPSNHHFTSAPPKARSPENALPTPYLQYPDEMHSSPDASRTHNDRQSPNDNRNYHAMSPLENRTHQANNIRTHYAVPYSPDDRHHGLSPSPDRQIHGTFTGDRQYGMSPSADIRYHAMSPSSHTRSYGMSPSLHDRNHGVSPSLDNRSEGATSSPGSGHIGMSPSPVNRHLGIVPSPDSRPQGMTLSPDNKIRGISPSHGDGYVGTSLSPDNRPPRGIVGNASSLPRERNDGSPLAETPELRHSDSHEIDPPHKRSIQLLSGDNEYPSSETASPDFSGLMSPAVVYSQASCQNENSMSPDYRNSDLPLGASKSAEQTIPSPSHPLQTPSDRDGMIGRSPSSHNRSDLDKFSTDQLHRRSMSPERRIDTRELLHSASGDQRSGGYIPQKGTASDRRSTGALSPGPVLAPLHGNINRVALSPENIGSSPMQGVGSVSPSLESWAGVSQIRYGSISPEHQTLINATSPAKHESGVSFESWHRKEKDDRSNYSSMLSGSLTRTSLNVVPNRMSLSPMARETETYRPSHSLRSAPAASSPALFRPSWASPQASEVVRIIPAGLEARPEAPALSDRAHLSNEITRNRSDNVQNSMPESLAGLVAFKASLPVTNGDFDDLSSEERIINAIANSAPSSI